jgi:hypothetical protein
MILSFRTYILAWVLTINQKQYSECRAIKKCHLFDPLYWQISLRSKQHAIYIYFLSICLGSSLCSVPIVTFFSIRPIYTAFMISECNLQLAYLVVISGLLHKEIKRVWDDFSVLLKAPSSYLWALNEDFITMLYQYVKQFFLLKNPTTTRGVSTSFFWHYGRVIHIE